MKVSLLLQKILIKYKATCHSRLVLDYYIFTLPVLILESKVHLFKYKSDIIGTASDHNVNQIPLQDYEKKKKATSKIWLGSIMIHWFFRLT